MTVTPVFVLARRHEYRDCAKKLWQHVTPDLNENTASHMSLTLALLASKRTTAMLVLPFLRDSTASTTRQLSSFRTTFHKPIAYVLPASSLSEKQLSGKDGTNDDQTIELWRNLLPDYKDDDVTPVVSQVVLLPGLCDDPRLPDNQAFHMIVENCDHSIFENEVIKLAVNFK